MLTADLHHPAVGAALATAADLLGMEVVFISGVTDDEVAFVRVLGNLPGVDEGRVMPRTDTFCHRMLSGAPPATADAANDPAYADVPTRTDFGITSYVGVPVRDPGGNVVGTLCGVDRRPVPVTSATLEVLEELAGVIEAHLTGADAAVVVRRLPGGWRVGNIDEPDLTSAMVLADLLAAPAEPAGRPSRPAEADEVAQLRAAVAQLEHALTARVTVEQAIGVLAERQHVPPRAAFERLRKASRSRGRKVHELARMVVASVTDPSVPLPPELAGRR